MKTALKEKMEKEAEKERTAKIDAERTANLKRAKLFIKEINPKPFVPVPLSCKLGLHDNYTFNYTELLAKETAISFFQKHGFDITEASNVKECVKCGLISVEWFDSYNPHALRVERFHVGYGNSNDCAYENKEGQ
jgi:hypothetical protein